MAIYLITPTEKADKLESIISNIAGKENYYFLPNKQSCFFNFNGNIEELTKMLNLSGTQSQDKQDPFPAVVTEICSFGGYAPSSLWSWLNQKAGA